MSVEFPEGLEAVLESAARLQARVPDAVLVGESAAAYSARHRMSGKFGADVIGSALAVIDEYYTDPSHASDLPVQSQLARQLADPEPNDRSRITDLPTYKRLVPRWQNWDDVAAECRALAAHVI